MTADAESRPAFARATVWLTVLLVIAAFAVRLAYLTSAMQEPGFGFSDPDHYMANGARLAEAGRWVFEAVHYPWGGRLYTLPPLYPTVLGLIAAFPGYPYSAAIAQIAINSLAVVALVVLGIRLQARAAGLIAGAIYAFWGGNIVATRFFMQEALYVPLVIVMFLALLRAYTPPRTERRFFIAGLALAVAALCRSMPIYFTAAIAVGHLALARPFGSAWRESRALVAGFALLTVPYSIALSLHLGRPTFIEDHGGLLVAHRFGAQSDKPPGLPTVAATLIVEFVRGPGAFTADAIDKARSVFHVAGGRWVEQTVNAPNETVAQAWKVFAHTTMDAPLVLLTILTIPGLVLMRNRTATLLFGGWIALNVTLVAITGFGGARLRSPFEPVMMLLAGIVLSGAWRPISRGAAALAVAGAAVGAWAVVPQLPRSLQGRGNYGVEWAPNAPPHVATIRDRGGFNMLLEPGGVISLDVRNPGSTGESLTFSVQGTEVARIDLAPESTRRLRVVRPDLFLAFVEVDGAAPSGVVIDVPRR